MDGREGMAYPGSASYYLNRGAGPGNPVPGPNIHGGPSGGPQPAGIRTHTPPVFKNLSNPNISVQPNVGSSSGGGSASGSPSFHMDNPSANFSHGKSIAVVPAAGLLGGEPVKKKRGRPRKYGPDGSNMSLGLSPLSGSRNSSGRNMSSGEKRPKGRPRGTGWKQKLAPLGEWMNSSAGLAFTPHVLRVAVGEDIAAKILAFAQQRARALCIMSGNGSVSALTLRQPTTSEATVTYEGRFEILCLSGSYLVADNGGPRNRTGGISISVSSPDGHIIGGAIGGRLTAASPVQVVACSFVYGNTKPKPNSDSGAPKNAFDQSAEQPPSPITGPSVRIYNPNSGPSAWPPGSRPEVKNSQTDIDLMRG
ncbi:AT hook motif DNA-binding family protein [Striga asiatica]|uniref:AT-hook motif nuclear-localized protein n=1 Tax=Striga asiatica TaxID=4170 RepID=A0A5A7RK41_STRAF|nr:AT hook motif DNA-binding family protein [Striga asiatica]